jgi:aromatic ring-opening dioxygenase catalytic subunit (LigB family)
MAPLDLAVLALLANTCVGSVLRPPCRHERFEGMTIARLQPAIFISHGGGPCFSMDLPGDPFGRLRAYLAGLIDSLPERPRAVLIVSGHWEAAVATVGSAAKPGMIYDYRGFPPHTYRIRHDAPGEPALARDVARRLREAGIAAAEDDERGFDHGVFVPMMVVDPPAGIPIATLSLRDDLDPAHHLAIGRALAPLRGDGVLILGSGNSFHDVRTFRDGEDRESAAFDTWLTAAMLDPEGRDAALEDWTRAPGAAATQPRPDHLLPLMVVAGAGRGEAARVDFHDLIYGKTISGYRIG